MSFFYLRIVQRSSDGCRVCGLSVSSSSIQDEGVWLLLARTAHAANAAPITLTITDPIHSFNEALEINHHVTQHDIESAGDASKESPAIKQNSWLETAKKKMKGEEKEKIDSATGGKVLSSSVSVSSSSVVAIDQHFFGIYVVFLIYYISNSLLKYSIIERFSILPFVFTNVFYFLYALYTLFLYHIPSFKLYSIRPSKWDYIDKTNYNMFQLKALLTYLLKIVMRFLNLVICEEIIPIIKRITLKEFSEMNCSFVKQNRISNTRCSC